MAFYPVEEQITNFVPLEKAAAPQDAIRNFTPIVSKAEAATAKTIEGVAGESLAIADLIASTPEFVMSTGFTVMDALNQVPTALMEGKGIDWDRARETGARVAKPFGITRAPITAGVEATRGSELDLAKAQEESKVSQGMQSIGTGIQAGAAKVEKKTGIPKAAVETFADALMVLGVPGAKTIKSKVPQIL